MFWYFEAIAAETCDSRECQVVSFDTGSSSFGSWLSVTSGPGTSPSFSKREQRDADDDDSGYGVEYGFFDCKEMWAAENPAPLNVPAL
jgi:hypothetical protein